MADSVIDPLSPANTVTELPVVVLLPVEVDRPVVALLLKGGSFTRRRGGRGCSESSINP